jgi:hypothetical protein
MRRRVIRLGLLAAVAAAAGLAVYVARRSETEAVLVAVLVVLLGRPGPDALRTFRSVATPPPAEPDVVPGPFRVPVRVTPGPSKGEGGA